VLGRTPIKLDVGDPRELVLSLAGHRVQPVTLSQRDAPSRRIALVKATRPPPGTTPSKREPGPKAAQGSKGSPQKTDPPKAEPKGEPPKKKGIGLED
jgi:hypothetical protein